VRVGVRVNDPGILERFCPHFPPGWKLESRPTVDLLYSFIHGGADAAGRTRRFNLLYSDSLRISRTFSLDEALEAFESDLQLYVAVGCKDRVFVHAGVVGWRGRAIVIPGRSLSGKTALVAELVRAGATYYSDEYAVVDAQGRVHPYARPLGIRENGGLEQKKHQVEEIGGSAGTKPLPVGLVVVTEYRRDGKWRPRALSSGQATLALLQNTVSARLRPAAALDTFATVVMQAAALKSPRGEARAVVDSLLTKLS